ncbi:MAG: hypothetical protein ACE365_05865 [Gammaproteobacteria bacterium]
MPPKTSTFDRDNILNAFCHLFPSDGEEKDSKGLEEEPVIAPNDVLSYFLQYKKGVDGYYRFDFPKDAPKYSICCNILHLFIRYQFWNDIGNRLDEFKNLRQSLKLTYFRPVNDVDDELRSKFEEFECNDQDDEFHAKRNFTLSELADEVGETDNLNLFLNEKILRWIEADEFSTLERNIVPFERPATNPLQIYQELGEKCLDIPIPIPIPMPEQFETYKMVFKCLIQNDTNAPGRQGFESEYRASGGLAYLACIKLFDQTDSPAVSSAPQGDEYKSRHILQVEDAAVRRFFRCGKSLRNQGRATNIVTDLLNNNLVRIDGFSSRSVIAALVNIMAAWAPQGVTNNTVIFSANFRLGATNISYEWKPYSRQKGNCLVTINGGDCETFGKGLANKLEELTETDGLKDKINGRTKKLGRLFLEKTKCLRSFFANDFVSISGKARLRRNIASDRKRLSPDLALANQIIDLLNGLLFLWSIAEPARRLSCHEGSGSNRNAIIGIDHIPVATMQLRALQLLAAGKIPVRDIFGESECYRVYNSTLQPIYLGSDPPWCRARYGVTTHKDVIHNYPEVKARSRELANIDHPLESLADSNSFFSRNYTKSLLEEGYGTGGESDGDDYSDVDLPTP